MRSSICYHTRLRSNHTHKVNGGTFGFTSPGKYFDSDTIERLVKTMFQVEFTNTGRAVFVDREGRQVDLYISVDPLFTSKGQEAQEAYYVEKRKRDEEEERIRSEQESEVEDLMDNLDHDEIIKRLKGTDA